MAQARLCMLLILHLLVLTRFWAKPLTLKSFVICPLVAIGTPVPTFAVHGLGLGFSLLRGNLHPGF